MEAVVVMACLSSETISARGLDWSLLGDKYGSEASKCDGTSTSFSRCA